jgi:hypothetical protein
MNLSHLDRETDQKMMGQQLENLQTKLQNLAGKFRFLGRSAVVREFHEGRNAE